jgi:hypothetical protein
MHSIVRRTSLLNDYISENCFPVYSMFITKNFQINFICKIKVLTTADIEFVLFGLTSSVLVDNNQYFEGT